MSAGAITFTPEQFAELVAKLTGQAKARPSVTIRDLFAQYASVRQHQPSWRVTRNRLKPVVRRLGDLPADQLSPLAWGEHRAARSQETNHWGNPVTPGALFFEFYAVKAMLKFGRINGLISSNPMADARTERVIMRRETWLEEADVQKLLDTLDHVHWDRRVCIQRGAYRGKILRAFILACVDSGLRLREAASLRHDRIGPDGIVELMARQTKSRRRRIVALTQRTLKAIREIPTDLRLVPTGCTNRVLREHRLPWVFINHESGDQLSPRTLQTWFRRAVEAAGLDDRVADGDVRLHAHDLRHTHASLADARGASATAIRDSLGHVNLGITEVYLHRNKAIGALALAKLMDSAVKEDR